MRFRVLSRDKFRCRYCGASSEDEDVRLHVDHIHPRSRGGTHDLDNLVTACADCNIGKGARLLGPIPANRSVPRGVWSTESPRRYVRTAPTPIGEFWHLGSHCATPMKIAAMGTHMGLKSYQSAWAFVDRLPRPAGIVQIPPLRVRDAEWFRLLERDSLLASVLHIALIQALPPPRKAAA